MTVRSLFPMLIAAIILCTACGGNNAEMENVEPLPEAPDVEVAVPEKRAPGELLSVGMPAPEFSVVDELGNPHSLAELRGQKIVLIFYPGDDTPGCTAQLCAVRDDWARFQRSDVNVYGVNPADAESHQDFRAKYNFPFPLLVDEDGEMTRAFGSRSILGIPKRTVYGIGTDGTIVFAERGMPGTSEILAAFGE